MTCDAVVLQFMDEPPMCHLVERFAEVQQSHVYLPFLVEGAGPLMDHRHKLCLA